MRVEESNIFCFVSHPTIIESSNKIHFGAFFVEYMELPEMFHLSKLNIWENKWSSYENKENNNEIEYTNEGDKIYTLESFNEGFHQCFINSDHYQFIPFTYGKSFILNENLYKNILIIFRCEDFSEQELLKIISPDELEGRQIKLISTRTIEQKSDEYNEIISKFNLNQLEAEIKEKSDGKKSCEKKSEEFLGIKKSELTFSMNDGWINNIKFLQKNELLLLWFIIKNDEIKIINEYFEFHFDSGIYDIVTFDKINCQNEKDFQEDLSKIFNL